ncbi:MAG: MaoC/PaaZ C-terminal domain-containing protein [Nakamurella sp.]
MIPNLAELTVGDPLPPLTYHVTRKQLVQYAGAAGDFNAIHWNQRVATDVGLPDVIAHGMFTMASAGRIVTNWLGDPGLIKSYEVRFTRPVVVADDDAGAEVAVTAVVGAVQPDDGTARIDITAKFEGQTVLGKARVIVALP